MIKPSVSRSVITNQGLAPSLGMHIVRKSDEETVTELGLLSGASSWSHNQFSFMQSMLRSHT